MRAHRRNLIKLKIARGIKPADILGKIKQLASKKSLPIIEVDRQELSSYGNGHQGVALHVDPYPYSDVGQMLASAEEENEKPFLLLMDTLQDPQNLGSLLRSAEAVGVHGVILPLRRSATVTPAVVNASSGASEHLLIAQQNLAQAIAFLKNENIWVIGLENSELAQPVDKVDLGGAIALVVGGEGEGMRHLVRESCDVLIRLPMRGQVESLNAAAAGSVVLYLVFQARSTK